MCSSLNQIIVFVAIAGYCVILGSSYIANYFSELIYGEESIKTGKLLKLVSVAFLIGFVGYIGIVFLNQRHRIK